MQTRPPTPACEKQICVGITVECYRYWTLSDKVLSFNLRASLRNTGVCVCVWLVHWGWVCCFNPEVFSCKTIPVGCYLKALQIVSETLSDNHTERIHPFEGSFASSRDQGRPLIVFAFFFLLSFYCFALFVVTVNFRLTLTVKWALNIVLAFHTFPAATNVITFSQ